MLLSIIGISLEKQELIGISLKKHLSCIPNFDKSICTFADVQNVNKMPLQWQTSQSNTQFTETQRAPCLQQGVATSRGTLPSQRKDPAKHICSLWFVVFISTETSFWVSQSQQQDLEVSGILSHCGSCVNLCLQRHQGKLGGFLPPLQLVNKPGWFNLMTATPPTATIATTIRVLFFLCRCLFKGEGLQSVVGVAGGLMTTNPSLGCLRPFSSWVAGCVFLSDSSWKVTEVHMSEETPKWCPPGHGGHDTLEEMWQS